MAEAPPKRQYKEGMLQGNYLIDPPRDSAINQQAPQRDQPDRAKDEMTNQRQAQVDRLEPVLEDHMDLEYYAEDMDFEQTH